MLEVEIDRSPKWPTDINWEAISKAASAAAISITPFAKMAEQPFALEISVKFAENGEVKQLNKDYRHKDKPTNILSFPQVQRDLLSGLANSDDGEILLGDMILARDICIDEAKDKDVTLSDHVSHLLVHGTLHLLGYDHDDEADALIMEALEVRALKNLGIADPYADQSQ
ncbi:rRNA maturation RNase YbeY [Parasphingorhabdus halotolerans]|uniref:Endoribonuclease YbeY n=2 Tax=Parasphingorhabdus halotolerans TaxID=2725558 RepID=A0A6H2DQP8_9SPHN|nr:rRNA maturation RNase YbeY [Parasphingorhabdus halotolerans]QJB70654.1 rRNA maturation RNase YbeY [Parasphingorhabdus halotolerans]